MLCEDVWVKYTDKKGQSYVSHHRVWDKARFLESKAQEALKDGGQAVQTLPPARRS